MGFAPAPALTQRANLPEKRHTLPERMARLAAIEAAGRLMGKAALAAGTGIPERTMRSYANAERGMPDLPLRMTARALRKHAADAIALAERVEAMLP